MKPLNEDMDAKRWATEFMERNAGKVVGSPAVDDGLLIAWFANAIMCGHDNARWKAEAEAKHLRMQIGYITAELQKAGDPRTTPEIVESAARATAEPVSA